MKQYLEVLQHILDNGVESDDRTGVGTLAVVDGTMSKYDLQKGFPAVTTKQLAWKALRGEFLWIMQGIPSVNHTWTWYHPLQPEYQPQYDHLILHHYLRYVVTLVNIVSL
jgi:thymidylate synthase